MVSFIDAHRDQYGVEPICAYLPIAPSTYHHHHHHHRRRQRDPAQRSARAQRDAVLRVEIQRGWDAHHHVYGVRKVWKQLRREGIRAARCTVGRLMRAMGLAGAVRGRAWITTTHAGDGARPRDLVELQFVATRPNQLWVADFTYVATWGGFVFVAFVIDVFARRVVGWARVGLDADRLRAGCARAGHLRPRRRRPRRPRASQQPGGTSRCATPTVSPTPASRRRSGAAATRTTVPSPSR